jgi:hypothetical protein
MGQAARSIYNLITILFLLLSCGVVAFVGFRLSQPPAPAAQPSIALPTQVQLPTVTPTYTPTNTPTVTFTPFPTETPLPTETPTPTETFLPSQPTNTPTETPPSAFETLQALQTQIVLTNSALSQAEAVALAIAADANTKTAVALLPTNTPTETPLVPPTATFTPSPTITPTQFIEPTAPATAQPAGPTATFTLGPTLPPLVSGPTESPFPFAARDQVVFTQNFANTAGCNWQGIGGQVFDLNGQPLVNIRVHVFGSGVDLFAVSGSNTLYGVSGWEIQLTNGITTNSYVVELQSAQGTIISPQIAITFPADCARNLAVINFVQTRPF